MPARTAARHHCGARHAWHAEGQAANPWVQIAWWQYPCSLHRRSRRVGKRRASNRNAFAAAAMRSEDRADGGYSARLRASRQGCRAAVIRHPEVGAACRVGRWRQEGVRSGGPGRCALVCGACRAGRARGPPAFPAPRAIRGLRGQGGKPERPLASFEAASQVSRGSVRHGSTRTIPSAAAAYSGEPHRHAGSHRRGR
jgi:hypothetical protein